MAAPRVLVVDDNQDIGALMQLLLEERGCEVRTATDGPGALEAAAELQPEVVFLDLNLPGMDGFELAERLLARGPTPRPTLVMLSGYVDAQIRDKALESGISAVVEKVGDVDALERALLSYLPGGAGGG